jgi:hypothetical protein
VWTVECGRVEIEIWETAIRIKGILDGALDIEEPLTKVTLCETVVWKGLFKLEEGLLSKLWARGNGGTSPLSFISLLSTSFLSLGSKHESKQTVGSLCGNEVLTVGESEAQFTGYPPDLPTKRSNERGSLRK